MKKIFIFLFLSVIFVLWWENCSLSEIRAMWVTRFQLDSKEKIDRFIKVAKENNFNNIFVQVVGRGQAYYNSSVIPRVELDFDPLAYTVEKSHKNGIKVHAWLNAYYVWSANELPKNPAHILNKHPDWIIPSNSTMKFLNPAHDGVKDLLYRMYLEVVENYRVDGIHFDYIRYNGFYYGLDMYSRKIFKEKYDIDPFYVVYFPQAVKEYYGEQRYEFLRRKWIEYRCEQVNELVEKVSNAVKNFNKSIKISAAVFYDIKEAIESKGQNWPLWLKKGWIDFAVPMIYTKETDKLEEKIIKVIENSHYKKILVGLGAYLLTPDELHKQYSIYKRLISKYSNLIGFNLFSYDTIVTNPDYFTKVSKPK